jgi:hypothetical protein
MSPAWTVGVFGEVDELAGVGAVEQLVDDDAAVDAGGARPAAADRGLRERDPRGAEGGDRAPVAGIGVVTHVNPIRLGGGVAGVRVDVAGRVDDR